MQVEEGTALALQLQADLGNEKGTVQQQQEQLQVCHQQCMANHQHSARPTYSAAAMPSTIAA